MFFSSAYRIIATGELVYPKSGSKGVYVNLEGKVYEGLTEDKLEEVLSPYKLMLQVATLLDRVKELEEKVKVLEKDAPAKPWSPLNSPRPK